jgi:hypothetical protein
MINKIITVISNWLMTTLSRDTVEGKLPLRHRQTPVDLYIYLYTIHQFIQRFNQFIQKSLNTRNDTIRLAPELIDAVTIIAFDCS